MPALLPGGIPYFGHALAFAKQPDDFMRQARAQHGTCVSVKFPGKPRTFLLDPVDYTAYFRTRGLVFRDIANEIGAAVFGYAPDLLTVEALEEMSQMIHRRMKGEPLVEMTARMERSFRERIDANVGNHEQRIDLLAFLNEHFFAAGVEALFGDGFYRPELFQYYAIVDEHFPAAAGGTPAFALPGLTNARRKLAEAVRFPKPNAAEVFSLRKRLYAKLAMPRMAQDFAESSLIWASQANTVATCFWTLLLVLRDPQARNAILREVREHAAAPEADGSYSSDQLKNLVLLDSAITEALRLTSMPMMARRADLKAELKLHSGETLQLAPGDELFLYPRLTHLDGELFPDPFTFRFDRFDPAKGRPTYTKNGKKVGFALLPFGAGVSMCPGRFFARNEIKIALTILLSDYDFSVQSMVVPPLDYTRVGLGVAGPTHDIPFRIRRRPTAHAGAAQ